ncbi:MAG: hypothetical protein J5605_03350 [Bacteroidales bacterium]|nr:hypothetical protein [Bacteroidales bacterium]
MKKTALLAISLCISILSTAQVWTVYNTANSDINGNTVLALATDRKGAKWIGTSEGLNKFSGNNWTDYAMFNKKLKGQFVNCLTIDKKGILWVGTDDHGVIEFDGTHWKEHETQTRKLKMKFIRTIVIDQNDVKWIGVTLGGLVRYDNKKWELFSTKNCSLVSDFILCITIDDQGNKWIGTNAGISVLDKYGEWKHFTPSNSPLPDNIVPGIAIDKKGVKWMATLGGLCSYDGVNWNIYTTKNSQIPSNQVNSLAFDRNGVLWLTTDKGVTAFDGKYWVTYTTKNSPLPSNVIQNITIDDQNNKWFGTDFYGITCFSGFTIAGRVVDDFGQGMKDIVVQAGNQKVKTDAQGNYRIDVKNGSALSVKPLIADREFTPAEHTFSSVSSFQLGKNFVVTTPQKPSAEKISIVSHLEDGYITVSFESAIANVEILNSNGENVLTVEKYKKGKRIEIPNEVINNPFHVIIRTKKGVRSIKLTPEGKKAVSKDRKKM